MHYPKPLDERPTKTEEIEAILAENEAANVRSLELSRLATERKKAEAAKHG